MALPAERLLPLRPSTGGPPGTPVRSLRFSRPDGRHPSGGNPCVRARRVKFPPAEAGTPYCLRFSATIPPALPWSRGFVHPDAAGREVYNHGATDATSGNEPVRSWLPLRRGCSKWRCPRKGFSRSDPGPAGRRVPSFEGWASGSIAAGTKSGEADSPRNGRVGCDLRHLRITLLLQVHFAARSMQTISRSLRTYIRRLAKAG